MAEDAPDNERELKTIKFQMMLSESESEQIDDWMFKNRVRSRAEAIRRLCQIAFILDSQIPYLVTTSNLLTQTQEEATKMVNDFMASEKIDVHEIAATMLAQFLNMADAGLAMTLQVGDTVVPALSLRGKATVEEGMADAEEVKARLSKMRSSRKNIVEAFDRLRERAPDKIKPRGKPGESAGG